MNNISAVFYSWQSDSPLSINKDFIRKALQAAIDNINNDSSLNITLSLDEDARGEPGMTDIPRTLLEKIENCGIFVADFTFVGDTSRLLKGKKRKLLPNPNVMLEAGYMAKSQRWEQIVGVINTAFGLPKNLPFDIHHRQWPIDYELQKVDSPKYKTVTAKLIADIEKGLRGIAKKYLIPNENDRQPPVTHISEDSANSLIQAHYKDIASDNFFNMDMSQGVLSLTMIPFSCEPIDLSNSQNSDMFQQYLKPMWGGGYNPSWIGDSYYNYRGNENCPDSVVQIKTPGTIIAVNTSLLSQPNPLMARLDTTSKSGEVYLWHIESVLVSSVISYLKLYSMLQIHGPYYVAVGLLNLKQSKVSQDPLRYSSYDSKIFRGGSITPELITIPSDESFNNKNAVANLLKPSLDYMRRSFGHPASLHFNPSGKWID